MSVRFVTETIISFTVIRYFTFSIGGFIDCTNLSSIDIVTPHLFILLMVNTMTAITKFFIYLLEKKPRNNTSNKILP